MADLTPRQREIAELVARGMSNKQIARATGLSLDTVSAHIKGAASRIPFPSRDTRERCLFWYLTLRDDELDSDAA